MFAASPVREGVRCSEIDCNLGKTSNSGKKAFVVDDNPAVRLGSVRRSFVGRLRGLRSGGHRTRSDRASQAAETRRDLSGPLDADDERITGRAGTSQNRA